MSDAMCLAVSLLTLAAFFIGRASTTVHPVQQAPRGVPRAEIRRRRRLGLDITPALKRGKS